MQYSLDLIKKRIKQLEKIDPLYESSDRKRQPLQQLKNNKKKIEGELKELKARFLEYINAVSGNPKYSFCDDLSKKVLIAHYCGGRTWKDAIEEAGLKKSPRNFTRDIRDRMIIADYSG